MSPNKDFTPQKHKELLEALIKAGYAFMTFSEYIILKRQKEAYSQPSALILLRHDVEQRYENALQLAQIQAELGVKGSYYFRFLPKSFNAEIVREIAGLGHEIGYHYDDLTACRGVYPKAIERFKKNLELLRKIAPVQSITMEGAPLSPYDNRDLWKPEIAGQSNNNGVHQPQTPNKEHRTTNTEQGTPNNKQRTPDNKHRTPPNFDSAQPPVTPNTEPATPNKEQGTPSNKNFPSRPYHAYGILAEPYFDIDFNKLYYITDTGRRWDGHLYNVRDKATKENPITNPEFLRLRFHSTQDIINAVENGTFPKQAMLNFHPQRWHDSFLPWMKELLWQNAKNQGKRVLVLLRK